jgi:hypothetical protein
MPHVTTSVTISPDTIQRLAPFGPARVALEAALLIAAATGDVAGQIEAAKRRPFRLARPIVNVRLSPGLVNFRAYLFEHFDNFSAWADTAARMHADEAGVLLRECSANERDAFEALLSARYPDKS